MPQRQGGLWRRCQQVQKNKIHNKQGKGNALPDQQRVTFNQWLCMPGFKDRIRVRQIMSKLRQQLCWQIAVQ
jgi:hypothetical protein